MQRLLTTLIHAITVLLVFSKTTQADIVPGRYIVELASDPVVVEMSVQSKRSPTRSAAAESHRAKIRSEQQEVRQRLSNNIVVLDTVNTVANALFVKASEADIGSIVALPGVRRVRPVHTVHMLLDRAVGLNGVTAAWNRLPADSGGAGIKVAIIDSGIDTSHPAFQDTLPALDSFPRTNISSDEAYTNSKIIVARSYVSLLASRDPDLSARDHVGHGTALAMIAAGVRTSGPLATITGIAPKAYLGNYKVFGSPGYNDETTDDVIVKAIDDAVADGMDVINLSLGYDIAPRLNDDPSVEAVERATRAGVIVVVAAGNNGSQPGTIASPATAPSAIAVGAARNDRTFGTTVEASGLPPFISRVGDGATAASPISAPFLDLATVDGNGLACDVLPTAVATGRIALIARGTCTFESKLNNAQRAGAVAALIYAAADSPDPIGMSVGSASLPAEMISYTDGLKLKQAVAEGPSLTGTLRFTLGYVPLDPNRMASFSSVGPNVDASIKPDVVAVGADMYIATQTLDPLGEMYDPSGYILVDGTSFAAPMVSGVAALLKSARPGLTVDQYRSLIINTTTPINGLNGSQAHVQQAGAGSLNAGAALSSTAMAYPAALAFTPGGSDPAVTRALTITNAGAASEAFSIVTSPLNSTSAPLLLKSTIELAPGSSAEVPVVWQANGLTAGAYEGFILISGATSGTEIRVPYWYAVTSNTPSGITILYSLGTGRRGRLAHDAILFRVTDAAGLPVTNVQPTISVVSGGGAVQSVVSYDVDVPGLFGAQLRLGSTVGSNVFMVQAGSVSVQVVIGGT